MGLLIQTPQISVPSIWSPTTLLYLVTVHFSCFINKNIQKSVTYVSDSHAMHNKKLISMASKFECLKNPATKLTKAMVRDVLQKVTKNFSVAYAIIMLYRSQKMLLLEAGFYAIRVTNVCESRKTLAVISPSIVHVRHKLILQTRAAPRQFSAVLTENFLWIAVTEKNVNTLYLVHNCPLISYLCAYSIYSNARWSFFIKFGA